MDDESLGRISRRKTASTITIVAAILSVVAMSGRPGSAQVKASVAQTQVATLRVDVTRGHVLNAFDPDRALGSSIDVLSRDGIDKVYTPHIIQESLSAGWGPISYRNNSELRMAAWHWTENGTWSDPVHKGGYFTGSIELKEPVRYILSYSLPHRAFSTSGDRPLQGPTVYWKSNPYLTSKFTGESDSLHPQWVVMDLQAEKPVSAIRIAWASPYARMYEVDYWVGKNPLDFDRGPVGEWIAFPSGRVRNAPGDTVTLKLAEAPVSTRYIRIWMTESSNTCDLHGPDDVRNCVGYAIQEIHVGSVDASGAFIDVAPDTSGQSQPSFCTSSIDPWHSAADINASGSGQHSGFDIFFTSGLTNELPAMIPVTLLYGTPDDAAAEIAYIEKRGYPIAWVEIGEEPDGKHVLPEDYASLYIQWATAIHKVDPRLKLGGPVFEGVNEDIRVWPDTQGRTSWMGRFIAYLKAHRRTSDLAFVSFEHYPFEPCNITWKTLYQEPQLMKHILQVWREDGVPKNVPLMVTESHLSAHLTGPMSQIFAALWLADSVGSFFEAGGAAYHHSPIQPEPVNPTCLGAATWSNFVADKDYNIKGYTSLYFAAHMINLEWVQHRSGVHEMFPSATGIEDNEGNVLVTSYAVRRPDGNWSLMLVNRDQTNPRTLRVVFEDAKSKRKAFFSGAVKVVTFGSEQYVWQDAGPNSYADPDGLPVVTTVPGDPRAVFTLPKASIIVLRGKIKALANQR